MDSNVVRVKDGWAVRLVDEPLERVFHYKVDAVQLKEELKTLPRHIVEGTYTLAPGHYFRKVE